MSKVAEFFVQLGADVTKYSKGMKEADNINKSMMKSFKNLQKQIDSDYMLLAKGSQEFAMSQGQLFKQINELGKEHKKITDQMINNNDAFRASIFQEIGALNAMTTTSEKMAKSFYQMRSPMRMVNALTLGLTHRMEEFAKSGNAAVVALKELGPQASNKALQERITLINQSVAGYQQLALLAAAATLVWAGAMHKLALATDETLKKRLEKSAKKWLDALQPLGQAVAEVEKAFLKLTDKIADFFLWLKKIDPVLAGVTQGFFALLVPLTLLLSPLAIAATRGNALRIAFANLWMIIKPVAVAFASIAVTVAIVAAAIAAFVGIVVKAYQESARFRKAIEDLGNGLKSVFMSAWNTVKPALQEFGAAVSGLIQTIAGESVKGKTAWETLGNTFALVVETLNKYVLPLLKTFVDWMATDFVTTLEHASSVARGLGDAWIWVRDNVIPIMNEIQTNTETKLTEMATKWNQKWDELKNKIKGVWDFIKAHTEFSVGYIVGYVLTQFLLLPVRIGAILYQLGQRVDQEFAKIKEKFKQWAIKTAIEFVLWLKDLPQRIADVLMGVNREVDKKGAEGKTKGKNAGGNVKRGFLEGLLGLTAGVGRAFDNVMRDIGAYDNKFYQKARRAAISLWNGWKAGLQIHSPSIIELSLMAIQQRALQTVATMTKTVPKMTRALSAATRPIEMSAAVSGPQPIDMAGAAAGGMSFNLNVAGNLYVRDDSDIEKISNQLYRLQQTQLRGRGVGGQIFGK